MSETKKGRTEKIDRTVRAKNLALIAAAYAFFVSAIFALTNPPFEAPDEPAHLEYVNFLVEHRHLPNQLVRDESSNGEGHQHPLYYTAAAAVTGAFNGGRPLPLTYPAIVDGETRPTIADRWGRTVFYMLRLLGAFLVAVLVSQVPRLAVLLGVDPLWPTLLVATLPQFLFIGSSISNDGLTALLCGLAVTSTIGASLGNASKGWMSAGLWTGLAFMAKKSAIILFPTGLLLLFLTRKEQARAGKNALWYVGFALLLASPILVRNQAFYGEPLANHMEIVTLQNLVTPRRIADPYFLTTFPMTLASSFVGLFGWTAVQVPMRLVALYSLILVPGLVRSLKGIVRSPQTFYLASIVLLNVIALVQYNLSFTQAQGRLLFPSLAALAALWGLGMTRLTERLPRERYNLIAGALAVGFVSSDAYSLLLNYRFYR